MRGRLVAAVLLTAVGCRDEPPAKPSTAAAPPATLAAQQSLVLGTLREPKNLDHAFTTTSYDREIATFLGRQLTEFDDQGQLIASAAETLPQLKTSTAGFDAVWQLAPHHWEDGRPVTVADLKRGLEVETNPEVASINFAAAKRVKAFLPLSSTEFVVRYDEPFADWRAPDVLGIVPAHKYPKKLGRGFRGLAKKPLSRGPYRLVSWVPGDRIELQPNPHWRPEPKLKQITVRFFPSTQGLIAALRTGLIDAVGEAGGLVPQDGHHLQEVLQDTHVVHFTRSTRFVHLQLRIDSPLLRSAKVRRDLSIAMDRESLKALAYRGHADNAYGMFPRPHPAHYDGQGASEEEVEAAKARLRKHFAAFKEVVPFEFVSSPSSSQVASVVAREREHEFHVHAQDLKVLAVGRILELGPGRQCLVDPSQLGEEEGLTKEVDPPPRARGHPRPRQQPLAGPDVLEGQRVIASSGLEACQVLPREGLETFGGGACGEQRPELLLGVFELFGGQQGGPPFEPGPVSPEHTDVSERAEVDERQERDAGSEAQRDSGRSNADRRGEGGRPPRSKLPRRPHLPAFRDVDELVPPGRAQIVAQLHPNRTWRAAKRERSPMIIDLVVAHREPGRRSTGPRVARMLGARQSRSSARGDAVGRGSPKNRLRRQYGGHHERTRQQRGGDGAGPLLRSLGPPRPLQPACEQQQGAARPWARRAGSKHDPGQSERCSSSGEPTQKSGENTRGGRHDRLDE